MADELPLHRDRLPTLTEVLELGSAVAQPGWSAPAMLPEPEAAPATAWVGSAVEPLPLSAEPPPLDEEFVVQRVLDALQPRIDTLLEARVSEALAPALARAADTLIRDSRDELMLALRELVGESLAQVLRDHRPK